jgi:hypothetical protein
MLIGSTDIFAPEETFSILSPMEENWVLKSVESVDTLCCPFIATIRWIVSRQRRCDLHAYADNPVFLGSLPEY